MSAPRRYRWLEDEDAPKGRRRVLVREHLGVEGFEARYSDDCTGCSERGDYGTGYGPSGCAECGYTGRRRMSAFVPFDLSAYERALHHASLLEAEVSR